MSLNRKEENNIRNVFTQQKIMTLPEICRLPGRSTRTAQRRLHHWQAYTSYNQNGRYYALPSVPRFDQNGLWHYQKVSFSRYGNLRETLLQLVQHSEAGLSGRELGELTGLVPASFLFNFREEPRWKREKVGSFHVYFSSEKALLVQQRNKRFERLEQQQTRRFPGDMKAVLILVERIKRPELTTEQLAVRLQRKGHRISVESIRHLFTHHGLVKKTAHGLM